MKVAVVGAGIIGVTTAFELGADGLGLISYYDEKYEKLKVAHCATTPCFSGRSRPSRISGRRSVWLRRRPPAQRWKQ